MGTEWRDESEWDAVALTMEAFEDAAESAGDVEDDSVAEFVSDTFETRSVDCGAPVSYVSEWQQYMDDNGDNF